jgi:glycine dehydrogenase subunit 1
LERAVSDATACVVAEHPSVFGCLEDVSALAEAAHRHGALLVVKVDPLSLALLASPGETGADVAVADGQALGSPPRWGAASLGLLACRAELAESLPCWRVERDGEGFRSVGTARAAVRADRVARPVAYLSALGAEGLARVAGLCAGGARAAQQRICSVEGFDRRFRAPFFKEFVVESAYPPDDVAEQLLESNILGPLSLEEHFSEMEQCLLFAVTERRTKADIDMLHHALDLLDSSDLLAL